MLLVARAALLLAAAVAAAAATLFLTSFIFFCVGCLRYRHLPGPAPSFPLGNADLLRTASGKRRPLPEVHAQLRQQYGDICVFFLGCTPVVLVCGAPRLTTSRWPRRQACCPGAVGKDACLASKIGFLPTELVVWVHCKHATVNSAALAHAGRGAELFRSTFLAECCRRWARRRTQSPNPRGAGPRELGELTTLAPLKFGKL